MAYPMGEAKPEPLRVDFDCRLKLEFPGSKITSDAGLLAYRELDDVLGLTDLGGAALSDLRRGKNTRHLLTGLLRQSVYGRLAGYEDVNDAERLSLDPAMRAIVDCKGLDRRAASTSQMGRFETEWLATEENFAVLNYLPGASTRPTGALWTSGQPLRARPLPHRASNRNRSGQLIWYINRSTQNVLDTVYCRSRRGKRILLPSSPTWESQLGNPGLDNRALNPTSHRPAPKGSI